MFARKVTNLACLGLGRVTRRDLAAYVGVQVGERAGAVAIGRDGLIMDVVDCYTEQPVSTGNDIERRAARKMTEVGTYGMGPATHQGNRTG